MAHNPEVEGSNPCPATKARGPLSNRKRASGPSFVNRFCKRRARSGCLAACASTVVPWSSRAEPVISNEVSDPLIRRLKSDCLRPACCRIFLSSTRYQGGSADQTGIGKIAGRGVPPSSSRPIFPVAAVASRAPFGRGSRDRLRRPWDPAAAHQGSAAMRKMGGHQETTYGAGGCDGIKIGPGKAGRCRAARATGLLSARGREALVLGGRS